MLVPQTGHRDAEHLQREARGLNSVSYECVSGDGRESLRQAYKLLLDQLGRLLAHDEDDKGRTVR
jgi:hypothetical protein